MTISQTSAGKKNDSEVKITVNVDVGCDHCSLHKRGRVGGGNIVNRMRKPRVTLINNRIAANSSIEKSSSYVQRSMSRKCCV